MKTTDKTQAAKPQNKQQPAANPAEVRWLSLFIVLLTVVIVWLFVHYYKQIENFQVRESVTWNNKEAYPLDAGPVWFWNNPAEKQLVALQTIDEDGKKELLKLYPRDSTGYLGYQQAIEELTFKTQSRPKPSYLLTLLLGGLAAMIGVQIRTIHRFLYHACYKGTLDGKTWWPWYALRPVIGFLLGGAIILLAQVNLFTVAGSQTTDLFWIGLSILVGFGTPDVVERLHKVSETLFGKNSQPATKPPKDEETQPPPPPPTDEETTNTNGQEPVGTGQKSWLQKRLERIGLM